MSRRLSWTFEELEIAVKTSTSVRQTILKLGLIPAGGNYMQIARYIKLRGLCTSHFTGKGWNKGKSIPGKPLFSLEEIMVKNSTFSLFTLKKRLLRLGLKQKRCEECGWAQMSEDGRIPIELDHINGDRFDNRLENLRILCPNCHSLKPTHRGRNKKRRGGGMVDTEVLNTSDSNVV